MDNQRLFLFLALSLVIMLMFNAWQDQFDPRKTAPEITTTSAPTAPQDIPSASSVPAPTKEMAATSPMGSGASEVKNESNVAGSKSLTAKPQSKRIKVVTDLLDVEINTMGGDVRRASLLDYQERADTPGQFVQIMHDAMPNLYVAQSGLLSQSGQSVDHHVVYETDKVDYQLQPGQDEINVSMRWQGENGLVVIKTYTFHRDSYLVDMNIVVENGTSQEWAGRLYRQLQRTKVSEKNQSSFIYTYMGGVVSVPTNVYEKVEFDDMASWKPEESFSQGGWLAMTQHYFMSAWIPKQDEFNNYYSNIVDGSRYVMGLQTGEIKVAAGKTNEFTSQLYVGPKIQSRLEKIAPNLKLTVDFGILTILAEPVFWLMNWIHGWVQNWGWSIIFVTLVVKLIFYKLSEAAYRSMAKMRKFQPKLQALKERYGSDRQRMSQAMMEIYKKEKINPLGGCLPMLVQIPVFISLYWVLLESVELRQADFMLWITDLSSKDPYYVLPLIMGASMLIQQRLNPAPLDPVQKRVMQVLPIVFTLFFAFFPAGLVLYWVVNNILSILQQWYITRKIDAEPISGK